MQPVVAKWSMLKTEQEDYVLTCTEARRSCDSLEPQITLSTCAVRHLDSTPLVDIHPADAADTLKPKISPICAGLLSKQCSTVNVSKPKSNSTFKRLRIWCGEGGGGGRGGGGSPLYLTMSQGSELKN